MSTNDIFEKLRHGRLPNPFPNTVREDGVFHRLAVKFFRGRASEDAVVIRITSVILGVLSRSFTASLPR
jgi:hypothetical protein